VDIVSAHRTPDKLVSYSRGAHERGLQCIIAGAGGAAHLPGMVAAMTPLPVIGVPVKTSALSVRCTCRPEPPARVKLTSRRVPRAVRVHRALTRCTASCRCRGESRWPPSRLATQRTRASLQCVHVMRPAKVHAALCIRWQLTSGSRRAVCVRACGVRGCAVHHQVRMLGATRPELREKMVAFQAEASSTVAAKGEKLVGEGYEAYLEGMANKSSTVM
jgi:phosphoribosylcarboxyaminoimidazole (NCAIR) mutase